MSSRLPGIDLSQIPNSVLLSLCAEAIRKAGEKQKGEIQK